MIVPPEEIKLVTGPAKKRSLWLPVVRGSSLGPGDRGHRRPCPVEAQTVVKLQPRIFVKGTAVTISETVLTSFGVLGPADAREAGYKFLAHARTAFEHSYGAMTGDTELWIVRFVLGDHTKGLAVHAERYLSAGRLNLTSDPQRAAHGEQAVPLESEMKFARDAALRREAESAKALQRLHGRLYAAVTEIEGAGVDLSPSAREEVRWLRRRVKRIEKELAGG